MFKKWRRRRQLGKIRAGDRSALGDFRFWQVFHRTLFFIELGDEPTGTHVYAVDVHYFADDISDSEGKRAKSQAALYRDGVQLYRSNLPATFPVPDGVIEVAVSMYGLTRMHYVGEDGEERILQPDRRTQEGLRARFGQRFPRLSAFIGGFAIVILLVGLVLGVPQMVELITHIDAVAERVGTFNSPIRLPNWANTTLFVAGIIAASERALTLRNHWLIDFDTTWTSWS